MSWRQARERALSIDQEHASVKAYKELERKVRDALWHSENDDELRERLKDILDDQAKQNP